MPMPIGGISAASPAWPIVTKPTSFSSAMPAPFRLSGRLREPPGGRFRAERLLDDERAEEADRLLAAVFLGHDWILVLEREDVVVADLEQGRHDAPPRHVTPARHA